MSDPIFQKWRSPLATVFDADVTWAKDVDIVESLADELQSPPAGVCDLSALPRSGFKGDCLDNAPPTNTSKADDNGVLCCRLSEDEVLLLSSSPGLKPATNMMTPRIDIARRDSHCQIGVCGERAAAVLSRLCAVPPPANHEIVQTRVAEVSAIIVAEPRAKDNTFYVLSDSAYAQHLWESLFAAVKHENGGIIGWQQWRGLFSNL